MASLSATRLQVSRPTAAKSTYSRRCVVTVNASGRQGATGGERAVGASECNRRTAIGLGVIAATVAPLPQSTAYAAGMLIMRLDTPDYAVRCLAADTLTTCASLGSPRARSAQWTMLPRSKAHTPHLASSLPPRTTPSFFPTWQTT